MRASNDGPLVTLVHGAIRRKSTDRWMNELRVAIAESGLTAQCFFWSGVPLTLAVRWAARKLAAKIRDGGHRTNVLWAKSTGADIASLASRRAPVHAIVHVAPAYVVTRDLEPSIKRITVELTRDLFLDRWSRLGVVRTVPIANNERRVVIEAGPGMDHHALNLNVTARLQDGTDVRLYQLYSQLIAEACDL